MQLEADAVLPFPRDLVFEAYRESLPELVEYLPNIRRIEVKERKEEGALVELVNEWHGGGEIPSAARMVLSDAMMSWTDYATWNGQEYTCAWRIETHSFTEAVSCSGKNRFIELSDSETRLEIRGSLEIDPAKVKGVPALLRGKVAKTVEDFLGKKITPNLIEVSDGLTRYLEKRSTRP